MNNDIYQQDVKTLAQNACGHCYFSEEKKNNSVSLDNPLCGDRITMRITLSDGKIETVNHHVKGCLLCQAAASVIGESAPGCDPSEINHIIKNFSLMLKEKNVLDLTNNKWASIKSLQPVAHHKSRHACVLLPFKALTEVLNLHNNLKQIEL